MSKIQGEGLENKGGVNEGPTTPRPAPPKGHAPEPNNKGRAEPGQVVYEFNGVPEPTCEGKWRRREGQQEPTVERVREGDWAMVWADAPANTWRSCRADGVTWSGPIPVPEDKPAKSEVYVREDVPPGIEWPPPSLETSGLRPPAPSEALPDASEFEAGIEERRARAARFMGSEDKASPGEDEGEKWGRRLYWQLGEETPLTPWSRVSAMAQYHYQMAALRFRAECVGPHKKALSRTASLAHELYATLMAGQEQLLRLGDGELVPIAILKEYEARLAALPDQAEAPKDKSRRSDEELGYSLQRWLLDEGLAEIALTAEEAGWFGAAIRARLERK